MKRNFQSPDFFNLDAFCTEEHLIVRDSIRHWVNENVSPIIENNYEQGYYSSDLISSLAELGVFGAIMPEQYGGSDLDFISYGFMMQELERGDSSLRVLSSIQTSLVMYAIHKFGSESLKQAFLPPLSKGKLIGSFGLTEPDHGSDPSSMRSHYAEQDDHILLNGSKLWIGNAKSCDLAIVWAKNNLNQYAGILVTADMLGFNKHRIGDKWSFRSSETGELVFENVKIPKDHILVESDSLKHAYDCLNIGRYAVAWGAIGIALDCYSVALNYAKEREQFGKTLASFQLIQKKFSEMVTAITNAQLMAFQLGTLMDKGLAKHEQVSMAKRHNVDVAFKVAHTSREILGAMGITKDYPVMRHILNIETLLTYQGTQDIHHLITGRCVTGISSFN